MFRSRILEHSRNSRTDQLYTPLRQALMQSSCSKQKNTRISRASSLYNLHGSKVSRLAWQLNPMQAEYLAKSILIPHEKLIPTHNLYKVQNKKYLAIKVECKRYPTISQQQFKRRQLMRNQQTQQIVYQIDKQQNLRKSNSIYDSPIRNVSESTIQNQSRMMKSFGLRTRAVSMDQLDRNHNQIIYSFGKTALKQQTPIKNCQNQNQYGLTPVIKNNLFSTNHKNPQTLQQHMNINRQRIPQQLSVSRSSRSSKKQKLQIVNKNQALKLSQLRIRPQKNINNVRQNKRLSEKEKLQLEKRKPKYNLFSVLDPIINHDLIQFTQNQIIATKIPQAWQN